MQNQRGSIHAIIIGLLTLGFIGTVGFIFWQNFIQKEDVSERKNTISTETNASDVKTKKVEMNEYCAEVEKICVDYPATWKVKATVEEGTDGKDSVDQVTFYEGDKATLYIDTGIDGVGGYCEPDESNGVVYILKSQQLSIQNPEFKDEEKWIRDRSSRNLYAVADYTEINDRLGIYVTGLKVLTEENKALDPCSVTYRNLFHGIREYDSVVLGIHSFFGRDGVTENAYTFKTVDDAKSALVEEPYKTLFDVVASAHYKS